MDRDTGVEGLHEAGPPPEARERVLRKCRRAMAEQWLADRRRRRRQHGTLAVLVAMLLLWNQAEERRIASRLQGGPAGYAPVAQRVSPDPSALRSLRARDTLVARLLRDADSL